MRQQKNIKRAQKDVKEIRKAKLKARQNKQEQSQKKLYMALGVVFLLIFLAAFTVPVSYIPFLNNIAHSFGLPTEAARQLTLLDLSLNSLGVETSSMKAAFENKEIVDDPINPVLYTRYEPETSHLIDVRKSYYYEFQRTRRRPDEISGIYQDGKEVATPALPQGQVGGVRSLPNEDYLLDDSYVPSNGEESTAKSRRSLNSRESGVDSGSTFGTARRGRVYVGGDIAGADSVDGAEAANGAQEDKRKTRKSFDKDKSKDSTVMPGFVSSVYANNTAAQATNAGQEQATTETVDINNSRMVKPVVKGDSFKVTRQDTTMNKLIGSNEFTNTLTGLSSFGGHDVLGFYVADDAPENTSRGLFTDTFGNTGEDAINVYFYSYVAAGRKYSESSKYLAEVPFTGDKVEDEEVLIARGQKEVKPPTVSEGIHPITMVQTVSERIQECEIARKSYGETSAEIIQEYEQKKIELKGLLLDGTPDLLPGPPGYCKAPIEFQYTLCYQEDENGNPFDCHPVTASSGKADLIVQKTAKKRENWNNTIYRLKDLCKQIKDKEKGYINTCGMDYEPDTSRNICDSIKALEVKLEGSITPTIVIPGVWKLEQLGVLSNIINNYDLRCDDPDKAEWKNPSLSIDFAGSECNEQQSNCCTNAANCTVFMDNLFTDIDNNAVITPNDQLVF